MIYIKEYTFKVTKYNFHVDKGINIFGHQLIDKTVYKHEYNDMLTHDELLAVINNELKDKKIINIESIFNTDNINHEGKYTSGLQGYRVFYMDKYVN